MDVLVVPIECDALVANNAVVRRDPVRWWSFNYASLQHFNSPEPLAFDRATTGQTPGVYLSWMLPAALREGAQDPRTGAITYPLVPNRWLVLRVQGAAKRSAVGWVIESDCPLTARVTGGNSSRTSQYLVDPTIMALWANSGDPYRTASGRPPPPPRPPVANIGIPLRLNGWRERAPATMFLTAVAPANQCSADISHIISASSASTTTQSVDVDTLSYQVIGWYSDPSRDIAASWKSSARRPPTRTCLRASIEFGGRRERRGDDQPLCRRCFNLAWNATVRRRAPIRCRRSATAAGNVALGNTTIDAFSALVASRSRTRRDRVAARLQLRPPAGPQPGERRRCCRPASIRNGSALRRRHSWTIVDRKSDGSVSTDLTPSEAEWLRHLNQDQAQLDSALAALYALQWTLNALWYKNGYLADPANTFPAPPQGIPGPLAAFRGQLAQALDPGQAGSIAQALVQQLAVVKDLLGRVPQPNWSATTNRQAAFQAGIAQFAAGKSLDPAKVLKAVAAPRYWLANNPSPSSRASNHRSRPTPTSRSRCAPSPR